MLDRTYEPHMDINHVSYSSDCKSICVHPLYIIRISLILLYILISFFTARSEVDEDRSLEDKTEDEEPQNDYPVQTDTTNTDGKRTGVIGTIYIIFMSIMPFV